MQDLSDFVAGPTVLPAGIMQGIQDPLLIMGSRDLDVGNQVLGARVTSLVV